VTFLAHQAPVLPVKRRWPGLDGVALVAGSMVPDLAAATLRTTPRYLAGVPLWWEGHTLADQWNWCLPVGVVLTLLLRRLVLPTLAPYLPDAGGFHLQDLRHVGRVRYRWWVIAGSILIGSVSHVLVDGFTHPTGWAVGVVPGLDRGVASVLQVAASVVLSAFAVWQMWLIGRDRSICVWNGVEPTPPVRPVAEHAVRAAAVFLALGAAAWAATQAERGRTIVVMTWFALSLGGAALLSVAVRVGSRAAGRSPAPAH
jgi:hypothetical protein